MTCKSSHGIVAAISTYLAHNGCNIIDFSQFDDLHTDRGHFMRISMAVFLLTETRRSCFRRRPARLHPSEWDSEIFWIDIGLNGA